MNRPVVPIELFRRKRLISNQAAYAPSWTSYFIGEQRCATVLYGSTYCAVIDSAGRVTATREAAYAHDAALAYEHQGQRHELGVPGGLSFVNAAFRWDAGGCYGSFNRVFKAGPILTDAQKRAGSIPGGWEFSVVTNSLGSAETCSSP